MAYILHLPHDSTKDPTRMHHDGKQQTFVCQMCGHEVTRFIKPKKCPECGIGKMAKK